MLLKLFHSKWLLPLLLLLLAVLHWPLAYLPLGRDQGVWNSVGFALFHGDVFYRDLLHFNLPGLGFSFAAFFYLSDDAITNVALLNYLASALIVGSGFYLFAKFFSRHVAVASSVLFVLFSSTGMDYWNIAQKDFLSMAFIMLATALLYAADIKSKSRWVLVFLSGFAVAVAVLYKPLFGIAGIFLAICEVLRFSLLPRFLWPRCIISLSLLLVGFLSLIAMFVGYIDHYQMLDEARFALFEFAVWYSNTKSLNLAKLIGFLMLWSTMPDISQLWLSLIQTVCLLPLMCYGIYCSFKHYSWKQYYFLSVPFLTSLFCYFVQKKGFPYHAMPWIVLSVLFVSIALVHLLKQGKVLHFMATAMISFILAKQLLLSIYAQQLLPVALGLKDRNEYLAKYYKPDDSPHPIDSEKTAIWIQQHVPKDKTIVVWGMENQIYALSKRRFFERHHFSFFLDANIQNKSNLKTWQQGLQTQYLQKLQQSPPEAFIFTFLGSDRKLSSQSINHVPELKAFIKAHYQKAESYGRVDIYQLNKK